MSRLKFAPKPQRLEEKSGFFQMPERWSSRFPGELQKLRPAAESIWPELEITEAQGCVTWSFDDTLEEQAYVLSVFPNQVTIRYGALPGACYGLVTLHQAVQQCKGELPCFEAADFPGLAKRGALWDISRGKVPTLQTLKELADRLVSWKVNHLELYMEGFSYAYPSFPEVWKPDSCLLPEEIKELDQYCKERFIELVPHQNSLGHMAAWLSRPEFRGLAEEPDGLSVMGMKFPPTTLDAADPESLKLVTRMMQDLLESCSSSWFHVGLDEAFEFGRGKNKEALEKNGAGALILPYIRALHGFLKERGIRMMMWDDFLVKHPELAGELPEDIRILDWGYDAEFPVEQRAELLKNTGKEFWLCPGTSSWSSFTGLTDNMLENVQRTAAAAHRYGASGMMVTDWGDMNHLQPLPVSLPGLLFAASFAWNREGLEEAELEQALNLFVFRDTEKILGGLSLKAGRFYQEEEFRMPCRSLACLPLMLGRIPKQKFEDTVDRLANGVVYFSPKEVCEAYLSSYQKRRAPEWERMDSYLNECLDTLAKAHPLCQDGERIVREYRNALRILRYLTEVRRQIQEDDKIERVRENLDDILKEQEKLWLARAKKSALEDGIRMFRKLA